MKKRYYFKAACLSILSLFAVSCLDLEPKAQLGDNLVWDKADKFSYISKVHTVIFCKPMIYIPTCFY